jgi:hypothetical protein
MSGRDSDHQLLNDVNRRPVQRLVVVRGPVRKDDARDAFAAYVRDHGDYQLRVAVLLTGDWHAAKDLVQSSLVKLYRPPRMFTP